MKRLSVAACLAILMVMLFSACDESAPSSDRIQTAQQETILKEATAAVGMPAIHNFRERRLLKDILELRDQTGLLTYTYIMAEQTGQLFFFCDSIGYGIPYATQYTSPQKVEDWKNNVGYAILPQADPNGLFSPASAEGTWVMCKEPGEGKPARAVYIEPRIIVSPFRLPQAHYETEPAAGDTRPAQSHKGPGANGH